jgi:hypothetical protein
MEIKDILKELVISATSTFNQNGQPENFDLEDFISAIESYYRELDDLGEFYYEDEDRFDKDWDDQD